VLVIAQFVIQGSGQLISVLFDPSKMQLAAVVVALVVNMLGGFNPNLPTLYQMMWGTGEVMSALSYPRWLMEALFIVEFEQFPPIYNVTRDALADAFSYHMSHLAKCLWVLAGLGVATRILTFIALTLVNRHRQV